MTANSTPLTTSPADWLPLAAKVAPPVPPDDVIARPALEEQLSRWRRYRLIWVIAPAGYGKSTLAACFLRAPSVQAHPHHSAWLSLDGDDDTPDRFVAGLAAACAAFVPAAAAAAIAVARSGVQSRQALQVLLAELGRINTRVILVLDDLHRLQSPAVFELLNYAVERSPANLTWMLLSRRTLPINLAKLRLQGSLLEVATEDLRLQRAQLEAYLALQKGLAVDAPTLDALEERAQGWVAGIQLALLSTRLYAGLLGGAGELLTHLRGDNVLLAEYLTDEVLAHQTEEVSNFLIKCSILDRLHPDLCNAVTATGSADRLLKHAMDQRLFLRRLDAHEEWYELHHLFRDLLRRSLRRRYRLGEIESLYRTAAVWYEAKGDIVSAVRCLLEGGAPERAAGLVSARSRPALLQNRLMELRHWLSLLPQAQIDASPQLLLDWCWCGFFGNLQELTDHVQHARQVFARQTDLSALQRDELRILELLVRYFTFPSHTGFLPELLAAIPEFQMESHLARGWAQVVASVLTSRSSPDDAPRRYAQQALDSFAAAQMAVGELYVLGIESNLALHHGEARRCLDLCTRALALTQHEHNYKPEDVLLFVCLQGEVLFWLDRLAPAAEAYRHALTQAQRYGDALHAVEAISCLRLCDAADGEALVPAAVAFHEVDGLWESIVKDYGLASQAQLVYWEILYWTSRGEAEYVWRAFARLKITPDTLSPDSPDILWLTTLLAYVAGERWDDALDPALARLQPRFQQAGNRYFSIMVQLVVARRQQQLGQHNPARTALRQALRSIEETGYVRMALIFPELIPVLRAIDTEFTRSILKPPLTSPAGQDVPTLTRQEKVIYALLCEGLTTAQIAAKLSLTQSTVKSHLHRLFAKLGVKNRRQAVARAIGGSSAEDEAEPARQTPR